LPSARQEKNFFQPTSRAARVHPGGVPSPAEQLLDAPANRPDTVEAQMIDEAEAVVIGAGAFGASIAFHLAQRGRRVALVERHGLASQTSPRAAGLTQQIRADALMTEIAMRSVTKIVQFTAETGEHLPFHQSGSIKLARTQEFVAQIDEEVERGQALGIPIHHVDAHEANTLAPFLHAESAQKAWYNASDLFLEPVDLPTAYIRAAEKHGAAILEHTSVTAIGTDAHGAVERVLTKQGEIHTPVVVDAAGAWARVVAEMTGIRVPIVPTRHQLYITRPIPGVTAEQPIVRVLDVNVYVRPERGGLLFGGYEPDPLQVDVSALDPDFDIKSLTLDFEPLRKLTDDVRNEFPDLYGAEIDEFRGGLPTMTADGRLIVDQVPGVQGFFVASGCCVGGLSVSPAVGELVADWIVDGAPALDVSSLSLTRFGAELATDEQLQRACLWRYAHHYSAAESPVAAG
jgi:glycine/D-amino acid oxidase-like deaminating enzyme